MSEVLVLHASLCGGASTAAVTALLDALPYAYRLALERRDAPDRIASLTAIALLLEAVRRVRGQPADPSRLRVPPGGKPILDGGPHSTARAAVAVCEHSELGLDLEEQGAGGRTARELERWVATEAVLKAVGAGLRQAPAVRLDDDLGAACFGALRLRLSTLAIAGNCVARLASHDELSRVTVEEIDWPA
jgi:hypothetical protein